MSFFRSEKMSLWMMMIHVETAYNCAIELGYSGCVEFVPLDLDGNEQANMMFVNDVRRCLAMQQTLNFIESELADAGKDMVFYPHVDEENKPNEEELSNIEMSLEDYSTKLKDAHENRLQLKKRKNMIREWHAVVVVTHRFLVPYYSDTEMSTLVHDDFHPASDAAGAAGKLHYIAGTIDAKKIQSFRLMIYRFFGHNILIKNSPISEESPKDKGQLKNKHVVVLMNIGTLSNEKVLKLCRAYHVTLYECPESPQARIELAEKLERDIEYIKATLYEMDKSRVQILEVAAGELYIWKINLKKSLMAYVLLNKLSIEVRANHKKYLKAECWIPDRNVNEVNEALMRGSRKIVNHEEVEVFPPILQKRRIHHGMIPPTHFYVNKFTRGFQNLIDSYGIANYRELNPAPYTIITFPFLFSMMYSDIGHGLIIALAGYYLIRNEKRFERQRRAEKKENEVFNIIFSGRYIIFLMGLFSIYAGFCYNDIMGKCLNIFGSSWYTRYKRSDLRSSEYELMLDVSLAQHFSGSPYTYGVDPMWDVGGEDSITSQNSLKMKVSIVVGMSQMMFGLTLAAINAIGENRLADVLLVILPSIIFMLCLFGYLVFLIFFKWLFYGGHHQSPYNTACAPSILITFINMILFKQSDEPRPGCEATMYHGQLFVQTILVVVAALMVPIILAGKPIYLMIKIRRFYRKHPSLEETNEDMSEFRSTLKYSLDTDYTRTSQRKSQRDSLEMANVSDIWIHSGIHCIETVLGSVSHTASYLRLWALSLAHFQLSAVLWKMILEKVLVSNTSIPLKAVLLSIAFVVWAILTLAILVSMESLSAFLHTLRLHWVEFQSKFYGGTGIRFEPFHFPQSTIKG